LIEKTGAMGSEIESNEFGIYNNNASAVVG
jgi:hypothetical protein